MLGHPRVPVVSTPSTNDAISARGRRIIDAHLAVGEDTDQADVDLLDLETEWLINDLRDEIAVLEAILRFRASQ